MANSKHHTFIGKLLSPITDAVSAIGGWFGNLFKNADHNLLQSAITITEKIKEALNSGSLDIIASLTGTKVDDKLLAIAKEKIPILLADEVLLVNVNTTALTEDATKELINKVVDSFGGLSDLDKQQFYTTVAAKLYIFFKEHQDGNPPTFGQAAALVEGLWEEWIKYKDNDT